MTTIMSLVGIVTLFGLALLLSENRRHLNFRTLGTAFGLQVAIAALILYVPRGDVVLNGLVQGVQNVIDYANVGIKFLFGPLGEKKEGVLIFAIHVLPVIVFFASLMATLYYLGIMQKVVSFLGGLLHRLLQTSRTESMSAVSNIFMGHTEAPLVVRPYLAGTTNSELFAIMTVGMATIAGAVMAGFAAMGVEPQVPDHGELHGRAGRAADGEDHRAGDGLPRPEPRPRPVQRGREAGQHLRGRGQRRARRIDARAQHRRDAARLHRADRALNGMIGGIGGLVGLEDLTFQQILGYVLAPLAFVLGVPWSEAIAAGSLIGQKFVVNEFVAYVNFVDIRSQLSNHTQVVMTFALCGFANLSSIAMMLGGLGSLVPGAALRHRADGPQGRRGGHAREPDERDAGGPVRVAAGALSRGRANAMKRAVILVLDSFGIGAAADADHFGDVGADTLGHIAEWRAARRRAPLRAAEPRAAGPAACRQREQRPVSRGLRHGRRASRARTATRRKSAPARTRRAVTGKWPACRCSTSGVISADEQNAFPGAAAREADRARPAAGRARQLSRLGDRDHRAAGRGARADGQAHRLHLGRQRLPDRVLTRRPSAWNDCSICA